jgi:hypothetical protein
LRTTTSQATSVPAPGPQAAAQGTPGIEATGEQTPATSEQTPGTGAASEWAPAAGNTRLRTPGQPKIWQRTDTVGTELVIPDGENRVCGTAVVAGHRPYATRWQVWLSDDHAVQALDVTCEGHGWRRELRLSSDGCRTQAIGDLDAPEPGLEDPSRLADAVIRLAASPVFMSWAMRALQLEPGGSAVTAPTALVLTPSLTVVVGESRYQRLGDHRLRVTGDEPAATYDLDADGMVTYQPGRLRAVR